MHVQPGQVIADRFRLVRELGRGGVGAVWLASQIALDAPCAIKFFIGPEIDLEQYCRRFEFEAKAAARLHHPNVVRILDTGMWEGRPYIAMEFLEGEGLDARLRRRGRLLPNETIVFCYQVGAALMKVHSLGIVHRDLKPSNIFLAREPGRIVVKLIDFGIAKTSAFAVPLSQLTRTQTILGTPAYMSPEQIQGIRPLDGRSDLWSLGVIVFECLTGRLPFEAATLVDVFGRIMYTPIPVPSQVAPWLPPAFDAWWQRAAARDVNTRFQTAAELCDALSRALDPGASAEADATWWSNSASVLPRPSSIVPRRMLSSHAGPPGPSSDPPPVWMLVAFGLGGALVTAALAALAWTRFAPASNGESVALEVPSGAPLLSSRAAPSAPAKEPEMARSPLTSASSDTAPSSSPAPSVGQPDNAATSLPSKGAGDGSKPQASETPRRSPKFGF
jgi:serine/threonine-protein kinase